MRFLLLIMLLCFQLVHADVIEQDVVLDEPLFTATLYKALANKYPPKKIGGESIIEFLDTAKCISKSQEPIACFLLKGKWETNLGLSLFTLVERSENEKLYEGLGIKPSVERESYNDDNGAKVNTVIKRKEINSPEDKEKFVSLTCAWVKTTRDKAITRDEKVCSIYLEGP